MAGKYLIDVTDARFLTPQNDEVISFIRRTNPFSHSDVGSVLLSLGKEIPGAHAYCPSYSACAYVVLHTDDDRIFAISYGQHAMAFALPAASVDEAVADGGVVDAGIGPCWVRFEPWHRGTVPTDVLLRWARCAAESPRSDSSGGPAA